MKKILLILTFFLITGSVFAQSSYFYDSTLTGTKRITALESTNLSATLNPLVGKQYMTVLGKASGDIKFSSDSTFPPAKTITISGGDPILISNEWLPKHHNSTLGYTMWWFKPSSGTITVSIQYRVW